MEFHWPILSLITFIPFLGAILILFLVRSDRILSSDNARWLALFISIVNFFLSLLLWTHFQSDASGFQFVEVYSWIPMIHMTYNVGIDGISLFFVLLSTFLIPICIVATWKSITKYVKAYMCAFLVLESTMIGTFVSLNLILFYIFFESVLIPMYIIVGVWGGTNRIYAAFKFFLYTFLGSLFMFLGILMIYHLTGTFDLQILIKKIHFSSSVQKWLWIAFFIGFAVKIPMFPFHTWLPDTHVEAPTSGSVILAAILLKMGGYGFLRFSLPLFPDACMYFSTFVFILSIIAVIYTSFVALAQTDIKKMIAYSSIAHMGFVTAAIFSPNVEAITGSIIQMISHGLISGALFLCVGVLYDRLHTREISAYGGLASIMPKYAFIFMILVMASVGLPGTSGFVGEFLILIGSFQVNTWLTLGLIMGMILSPAYMLYLYRRVIFGVITKDSLRSMKDLASNELLCFIPILFLIFWIGIYPKSFTLPIKTSVSHLVISYNNYFQDHLFDHHTCVLQNQKNQKVVL